MAKFLFLNIISVFTGALVHSEPVFLTRHIPYVSSANYTLFDAHAETGYSDDVSLQVQIDRDIKKIRSIGGNTIAIGRWRRRTCEIGLAQIRRNPDLYRSDIHEEIGGPIWPPRGRPAGTLSCNQFQDELETRRGTKFYPSIPELTAFVGAEHNGEHSIYVDGAAIFVGGNYLGCSGESAANVLAGWYQAKRKTGRMFFVTDSLYNFGCFDFGKENNNLFEMKRLRGKYVRATDCLSQKELQPDKAFLAYAKGFYDLLLASWAQNPLGMGKVDNPQNLPSAFSIKIFRGNNFVGSFGTGPLNLEIIFAKRIEDVIHD